MNDKEMKEYNLEYLEALANEEMYGGDYTSAVELKYREKEIEQLQQENEKLKSNWNKLVEDVKEAYEHSYNAEVHFVLNGLLNDIYKMQDIEEKNK